MKKGMVTIIFGLLALMVSAQSYEGVLKIDYKDEAGKTNGAELFIKGDKCYIKKTTGGCEKYIAYIMDMKVHSLTCLSDHAPKTAVVFNSDKVLSLYEANKFKPGYKVHESQSYKPTNATKSIAEITAKQKKSDIDTMAFEIWPADLKVDFHTLIPVLRIAGFWNKEEDGSNVILEGKTMNRKTSKSTSINVVPTKMKINEKLFDVPKEYQVVDLNKFITEQASSPKLGDLVRAFAGF